MKFFFSGHFLCSKFISNFNELQQFFHEIFIFDAFWVSFFNLNEACLLAWPFVGNNSSTGLWFRFFLFCLTVLADLVILRRLGYFFGDHFLLGRLVILDKFVSYFAKISQILLKTSFEAIWKIKMFEVFLKIPVRSQQLLLFRSFGFLSNLATFSSTFPETLRHSPSPSSLHAGWAGE